MTESRGIRSDPAVVAYLDLVEANCLGIRFPPDVEAEAYAIIDASPYVDFMRPLLAALDDPEELDRLAMQTHVEWLMFMVSRGGDEHTIDYCNRHLYEVVTGHDPGPSAKG